MQRRLADEIAFRFTGKRLPWYELEVSKRLLDSAKDLHKFCSQEDIKSIKLWYQQIINNKTINKESILGIVCGGGFLEGVDESEFVISFNSGTNFIIGERGSGKSTILNLLGVISDSVGVESRGLVQKLLKILSLEAEEKDDELSRLIQRSLEKMRFYGINIYVCYYTVMGIVFCLYIDTSKGCYELLTLERNQWIPLDNEMFKRPSILFLEQGEVFRIAEEPEKSTYLNNIMDAIYPDLYQIRFHFTKKARNMVSQYENFNQIILVFILELLMLLLINDSTN